MAADANNPASGWQILCRGPGDPESQTDRRHCRCLRYNDSFAVSAVPAWCAAPRRRTSN